MPTTRSLKISNANHLLNGVNIWCKKICVSYSLGQTSPKTHIINGYLRFSRLKTSNERVDCSSHYLFSANPREMRVGNQKRGNSMNAGPQSLAGQFRILGLELPCGDTVVNATAQKIKGLNPRRLWFHIFFVIHLVRQGRHKRRAVVMRIFEPKFNISD